MAPEQRWATATADETRGLMAKQRRTQTELADVLQVSPGGVSRRLQGKVPLDINELGAIADWLGVPITRLFGEPGAAGKDEVSRTTRGYLAESVPITHGPADPFAPDPAELDQALTVAA